MYEFELSIDQIAILQEQQSNLQEQLARAEVPLLEMQQEFRAARNAGKPLAPIVEKMRPYKAEYIKIETELQAVTEKLCALEAEKQQAEQERQKAEQERQKAEREHLAREEAEKVKSKARAQWTDAESRLTGNAARVAESIVDKLKIQITPSTECVELNDKFTKILFSRSPEQTAKLLSGVTYGIVEKRRCKYKGKVKDKIVSNYTMVNVEGYTDTAPLTEFDRAVLGVIISEYLAGNAYTTVNIIFRALIGKVGEVSIRPRVNQREAIIQSVMRLMGKTVDFRQFAKSFGQMKYTDKDGNELKFGVENLLSAGIVDAVVNGQAMDGVIYFKDNSPLFDIADAKNQIIRYPHELLNVPNQNNTPRVITLKKYVIRRICEIKLHKQLAHTITFDDVFAKCRVADTKDRKEIMRRRNYILDFVKHLQNQGFIKSFEVISRGGAIHGFSFDF